MKGQLGLEKTPELYVARMVEIFREVRRVLRDDGTLWLNLGDSYHSQPGQRKATDLHGTKQATNKGSNDIGSRNCPGLKPKDLCGMPWRVAFALQADGWYLRSDIIWHKPNPMPESVTDRPTKAHEYLFLLAKSQKYFYDAEAVKEPQSAGTHQRFGKYGRRTGAGEKTTGSPNGFIRDKATYDLAILPGGRNRRTVWLISTKPYKGAHFATFPPKLIEPCILAGCPKMGTVLDPFMGAGTTLLVAQQHGRDGIGIELNPAYVAMAQKRLLEAAAIAQQHPRRTPAAAPLSCKTRSQSA